MPAHTVEKLRGFLEGEPVAPPARPKPSTATAAARSHAPTPTTPGASELATAIHASKRAFTAAAVFSVVINILMLTGPLFMLQVYDRVMTSGSIPTLVALSALTGLLYAIIGALELVRSRIIVRIGLEIEGRICDRVFEAALKRAITARDPTGNALRDLETLRQFVASQGPLTLFDAPWTLAYLLVVFLLHWVLGITAAIGAVALLLIAWASEIRSRAPLHEAGLAAARSLELSETGQRNAESIAAMGMLGAYRGRWRQANGEAIVWAVLAADRLGSMSALSKTLRLVLQSLMLAVGAALALEGQISAGAIVAGTIIFGRALAPVEQVIAHWRNFNKARDAYANLDGLLAAIPPTPMRTALPAPTGHLAVTALRVAAPQTRQLILGNITFQVAPGQVLAVIGPSASGKSTLMRALAGLWPTSGGTIEIDGARLDQWAPEALGRHIGYLPQGVELFAGTLRDNIARFRTDVDDARVIAAAKAAHAHDMILALPNGYDTEIGAFGMHLSAGQRQRVALARALFDNPALVVLDEPNANLDRTGDEALAAAIDGMRRRGQTVVLVSHRMQALGIADLVLYVDRGLQRAFGPREDVLRQLQVAPASPHPAPQSPKQPSTQPARQTAAASRALAG